MYENIRLISADIDGTIADSSHDPTPETVAVIEALRDKGYLFGLASGRPVDDLMNKFSNWGMRKQFDFIIGWNGGDLYDDATGKTYAYNRLKKEWIREIIGFMSEFDVSIHMYLPTVYLSSVESDRAWFSAWKNHRQFVAVKDVSEFWQQDNGGIMFRCRPEDMDRIERKLDTLAGKEYVGFKTQPDLIEFSHRDCSKGDALRRYCLMHGISLMDCMSFGDTSNDNSMLEVSYGVCLLNGSADTRAAAKEITEYDCDHEGFARYVKERLL